MKNNHKRSKLNFILAFLLITALVINEGVWPFAQAGGLNTQSIRADDFSGDEVYIDDSNLFEDASGSASQDQSGDIMIGDQVSSQDTAAGNEKNSSSIQGSAQRTENQKELLTSEGQNGISVLYTEGAGIPEDSVLKLRGLKEKEIKAYLDRAKNALSWTDPVLNYVRIYDLMIQKKDDVNVRYSPASSVMVEIRILDSAVMSQEQKQQFIRQNADLLDPNRTYTDLEQQFTELRQKYVQQMHLENLQIISLGQKDELLQTTTEDGVIRFKADKLYPYVLLMRSDDMQESSWDFNAGEDPAAIWSFEDAETEDILKEAEEASAEKEETDEDKEEADTDSADTAAGSELLDGDSSEELSLTETESEIILGAEEESEEDSSEIRTEDSEAEAPEEVSGIEAESEVAGIEAEDDPDEATETGDSMEEPVNAETDREDLNETEEGDAGLSDFEQTEENAGAPETEQQLVSSGEDYEISVVYGSDAKIPEGSELVVNEISENTGRFDTLSEQAIAALDTDEDSILAVKLVDVSIDKDGETIEPEAEVGITVQLTAQEDNQAIDTQVIAISDTAEVLEASENPETVAAAEAVTYETASQTMDTVYAIVTRSITKELIASDGNEYLVTVTYDGTSGIPSDAELIVSEIKEGDDSYEEYVAKSADALGERLDNLEFARAFDITLKNPETGEEYQPTKDVRVSIRLQNENLSNYENVDVVHIPDDVGGQAEVMDSNLNGEVVEFTTDGFSVYVLTAGNGKTVTPQYTFTFFIPNEDVSGDYKEYSFTDSQGRTIYHQIITDRSELVVPQLISAENADFVGWYEGNKVGGSLTLDAEPYDFGNITITENRAVELYAVYKNFATVIFHGQYDSASKTFPIAYTRRAELVTTDEEGETVPSAVVKIDDLSTAYTGNGGANMAFFGWSEIPITTPGASKDDNGNNVAVISTDEDGCITVTAEKHLYPAFKTVHRLTFYSAQSGKGADYVPAANYFAGDALPIPLPVTSMDGYTFQGWYTGTLVKNGTEETVNYGSQITKADGTLVASADDSGIYIDAGRLYLRTDVTLYAKWAANTETSYKIVIWTQDPSDADDLENSNKTYVYAESEIQYGKIGTAALVSQEYKEKSYQGYAYSWCDDTKNIEADGSTVLNVYYDKEKEYTPSGSYQLSFVDSVSEEGKISKDLPVDYTISYNESITDKIPADPTSGRNGYEFSNWYFDPDCTIPADLSTMPDHDLTVYAGWETGWYVVTLDPNYGALYGEEGESGTGATWFWSTFEGEPIGEYTHVTRNYEESSSGIWYYVDHAGDGHGGDNGWPDRYTYYTQDPSKATEDTTFEYAPGTYTYIGWYEVYLDESGNEIGEASNPYDFSQHVDHDTKLRLHWKKAGTYYLAFDAGDGTLEDDTKNVVLPDGYADYANVTVTHAATAPDGYTFAGWKVRGSDSNSIYTTGQTFTMHADDTYRVGGKDIVYLDAVYVKVGTAGIIYDANGGTLTEGSVDFGKISGSTADTWEDASGIIDVVEGTAAVSGLTNNTEFKLSDGTGFSAPQGTDATFLGWSDKAVCDNSAVFYSKDSTDIYAVSTAEPAILYAVWGVQVTYALNSEDAQWGEEAWDSTFYKQEGNDYAQTVDLGNMILEPANAPVYTGEDGRLFRYWATRSGAGTTEEPYIYTEYDFSQPVKGALDLYAFWSEPNTIRVHAVDASDEMLLEKTGQEAWTVHDITVSITETEPGATGYVEAPAGFTLAFVAVSEDVDTISEDHAVSAVKYDNSKKNVVVKYDGDTEFTKLKNGEEFYFVYYQRKALGIQYKSMGASGVLQDVTVTEAPLTTGDELLGSYNMTESISQPLSWADDIYTHYAFALGDADADTANGLSLLTAASSSEEDGSRPMLQIRNTWRGFEYTTDGSAWIDCGYAPTLYVIYYTQQPTVVMFDEKTVGTAAVMDTEFTYNYVITETKTTTVSKEGEEDQVTSEIKTVYDTAESGTPYHLKTGEANSTILFYSETESVDEDGITTKVVTAQTVTITQTENELFDTAVNGDEIEKSETLFCTCTADGTGGTKKVTFTNTHRSLPVEIHVAIVENDGETGGIIQRDGIYRNTSETSYKFDLALDESEKLLTKLPADAVFKGDTNTYALGAVVYGTGSEGSAVTIASTGAASVSYAKIKDDIYELVLMDESGKILDEVGSNQIYYLYYPMPRIRYVKEAADGTLTPVTGSLPNEQTGIIEVSDSITYNHDELHMNGMTVVQNQSFEIPLEGLAIRQTGNNFRMPPVLDDGLYERYLGYVKIGAGSNDATNSADLDVSDSLTLQIKVQNNTLQYSFDETTWTDLPLNGTPTIYAIYAERGYDLQISKTVDISQSGENAIFSGSNFALTITSSAITKDRYDAEGAENSTIAATPASGATPGKISFTAMDGTKIRIKGLGRGDYTITENGNENYVLTAKSGSIVGGSTSAMEVSDNTTVSLTLDTETKVDLTNSPRAICRIGDYYFYTLRSMVEYVDETITTKTAEAEMLTDYLMPAADTVGIPNGCNITLTTAESLGHPAIITRTSDLADVPLFTNNGALTLTSLTLEGNSIDAAAPMIQSEGNVTIGEGAELRNAVNGGAIHASTGDITIGGTIKNCSTAEGGAIHHVGNGTITLEGTGKLRENTATSGNGGAIYLSSGTIRIRGNSEISGNTASENGGAIFVGNAVVEVDQVGKIIENTAKEGGAIYAETGTITISETENLTVKPSVSENTATAGNGGAVWIGAGSVTVSDGSVSDNKAENGNGGAIYANTASVTISLKAEVENNNAQAGGAVYANSGAVVVSGGTVESNTALTGNGGAIYAGSGNVTVSGGSMSQNTAVEGNGGAIYADRGSVIFSGERTSISDNTAKKDGGAVYANRGTVTVSLETISGNIAADGKGGAIYAGSGTVSITGTALTGNIAGTDGGAVYAETGAVSVTNAVFGAEDNSGNTAGENGGAIYAGSGNVTVSGGSMTKNKATAGSGGAIYVGSGALTASNSLTVTDNEAGQEGGAVYAGSGTSTLTSVIATGNKAVNGAAVFTNTGRTTFSAGSYTENIATTGGAIGVGSKDARLYFTGNVIVKDNTLGEGENASGSNVYLDQDDDAVINIDTLGDNASIGIYVPDDRIDQDDPDNTKTLVDTRSVPGARFAIYTNNGNVNKIINDRFPTLSVQSDTAAKKLYWGNAIKVEVRYLDSFSGGFPPTVSGTSKYTNNSYYPDFNDGAISELAAELFTKYSGSMNLTNTAVYGGAFHESAEEFADYVTGLTWNTNESKWQLTGRDGTRIDLGDKKIIIYYAEPAYISIENNTDMALTIGDMMVNDISVINRDTVAGYGMVFAKNGAIRTALLPVSEDDLKLIAGASINLLIPGGRNMSYILDGRFGADAEKTVRLRRTGLAEAQLVVDGEGAFEKVTGTTLNSSGTYQILFGDDKNICKVVDAAGEEHPYSKISDAITDIKDTTKPNPPYNLATEKTATIEMLTDYLLPASDKVVIPKGYNITITTAAKKEVTYPYIGEEDRAILSRDSENTSSMITSETGDVNSKLTLKNLIIDGKSVRGNSAGGAVSVTSFEVVVDTVDFINVYASNGGALYVNDKNDTNNEVAYSKLTVSNSYFSNCNSTLQSGSRIGGGAIHFYGSRLFMYDCIFENCNGGDQAGAVFHRVDGNYNSWTTIERCSFTNCSAKAAGGLELDSKTITVSDCLFEHCVATERNGGGFNAYMANSATPDANTNCRITLTNCRFNDCQAYTQNGGGFRSTAVYTTVNNCTFTNTSGNFGGGVAMSNSNAEEGYIYGCTFERCTAIGQGGGVASNAKKLVIGDYTYTDDEDEEHTVHTTMSNCTSANEGGGIFHARDLDGSSLTITNATITGNQTRNSNKNGGGIYTNARTVEISGSTITDNTCTSNGGGVYAYSYTSLSIEDSDISGNTASGGGGGVWFDANNDTNRAKQVLTVKGSTVDDNRSGGSGGGIYTQAKNLTIGDSETKTDTNGKLVTSSVSNNTANTNGGGIYQFRNVEGSGLTITNATVSGNTSNNTNMGEDQGGGGIYAGVRTLDITNSIVSNNTAKSHGGGILFEIKNDTARNVMLLTVVGCTLDGNSSGGNGGGIYTRAKTVTIEEHTDRQGTETKPTPTRISNCSAASSGGGIYHNQNGEASTLTITETVIKACIANDSATNNAGGGGVYANVRTTIIDNSEISGNSAVRNGGGILALSSEKDRYLKIDHSIITGNTSGNQGGAIYTRSMLTLRNKTEITGNRLSTNTVSNAAGVYIENNRTLFVGIKDASYDTVTVKENYTSDGTASNLRLWENGTANNQPNNPASVYVYCNLEGEIRVVNAKTVGAQFGSSDIEMPDGFSDDNAIFKSDSSTLHGIIDRSDPDMKKIIWAGSPIAKLTDAFGKLLYMKYSDEGATYPAIFDRLDTGIRNEGSTVGAFSILRIDGLRLYYQDGTEYDGSDYCIKMLDDFETSAQMYLTHVEGRSVIFTTAGKNAEEEDGYPYTGNGNRATVLRGSNINNYSLLYVYTDLLLTNVVLDGNSESIKVNSNTRILDISSGSHTVTLGQNALLQNAKTTGNGAGVFANGGIFSLSGGTIRNCIATSGGGVYENSGTVRFEAGNIYQCTATNGGGVYQNNGIFIMSGGTINNCGVDSDNNVTTQKGGGVFVANSRAFTMTGGSIINNRSTTSGGGIAIGGNGTRLYFSGRVNISGNTCDASLAPNKTCNVELNQDKPSIKNATQGTFNTDGIINTNNGGLLPGSYIGVYVPDGANLYDKHGIERKPFGTFATNDNTSTFYSFVNDRNGLKGGIIENPSPNTIYWIQIFSLKVSKEVEAGSSTSYNPDEQFLFRVNIRGNATVSGQSDAKDIDSRRGEYGEMEFTSNGSDTTTAVFALKAGESVTGVNLSEGLTYEVIEYLTEDQYKRYAAMPMNGYNTATETLTINDTTYTVIKANTYSSTIGENKSRTDIDPYTSAVEFKNLMPICKITDSSGRLLYQKYTWNEKIFYAPAVYTELTGGSGAFEALNRTLYTSNGSNPTSYSVSNGVQIQMLISEYTLNETAEADTSKVTLTTASASDALFPKQDAGTTSTIRRAFEDGSMLVVDGDLTLETIILDGAKSSYTANADGGIAKVSDGGKLTIVDGATLQNSKTAEEHNGGAVYVEAGGIITMTGGTINRNESIGEGAGIYLEEGSSLSLSGALSFGGTGLNVSGNITTGNGNFKAGTLIAQTNGGKNYVQARQDIFIAEAQDDPASILLTGNLDVAGGSIWIWAEAEKHYAMMKPFAKIENATVNSVTYAAFRNAQPDSVTNCGEDNYLSGSSGENASFIYWAGGFDISFTKIDGFGEAQSDATFTLYTDLACTEAVKQGGTDATATSADGTDTYKNKTGVKLDKGTILFEQVPAGVYYMKETKVPEGYVNALTTDASNNPVSNVYIVLVGDGAFQQVGTGVLQDIKADDITAQIGSDEDRKDAAAFLIDPVTSKAVTTPDIAKYGIMNVSVDTRKVVLQKTDSNFISLNNASFVFEILRFDRTLVSSTDKEGNTTTSFTNGVNSVFFIDELPYGTYYLHETTVPDGYNKLEGTDDNWFILTVNENGVGYENTDKKITNSLNAETNVP